MSDVSGASDEAGPAPGPWAIPASGWKAAMLGAWREAGADNVSIVAAGVGFYGFLAMVPLLGSIVLSYGLIAEPATVVRDLKGLTSVMPADAAKLVGEQLVNVVTTSGAKKGLGLLVALGIALFGARSGAGAVVTALNIAYEEKEKRGFVALNLLSLGITAAGVLVAIVAVVAIAALGHLDKLIPGAPDVVVAVGKIGSYLLLLLGGATAAAALYRFGPSRSQPHWTWLTPGSVLASFGWMVLTLGFGAYVAKFGNYNATYGSLGAVVVLLTWLYLSSYILLLGAELNAELEREAGGADDKPTAEQGGTAAKKIAEIQAVPDVPATPSLLASKKPSVASDYLAARVASRAGRMAGLRKVGMASSGLATTGLALIRGRDRARTGVVLVGVAIGLAWAGGRKNNASAVDRDPPRQR